MKEQFEGKARKRRLKDALLEQRIVARDDAIANKLLALVKLKEVEKDEILIEQNGGDTSLYLIISGSFRIVINGRLINIRRAGNHVGEMAAIEPGQPRSATVVADELSVVAELSEPQFAKLADKFPRIWRILASELSRRLYERSGQINAPHEKIRLFVISSKEALPIARALSRVFKKEEFETKLWTEDVFKVSNYTLEDLEREIDASDFAVAIAHPDDKTKSRGKNWPSPRDNVIFELGLFMGRLGRRRAILMEPRSDENVKLPSDLAGIRTIVYTPLPGGTVKAHQIRAALAKASDALKKHIYQLGPRD